MKTLRCNNSVKLGSVIILMVMVITGCPRTDVMEEFNKDPYPPTVNSISPSNGASSISCGTAITVAFSEDMRKDTVESNFSLTGTAKIPGTFAWSGNSQVSFMPTSLGEARTYTVTLSGNLADINGTEMGADYITTFTTYTAPEISSGDSHILFLKSDSTVWGWGKNGNYQLYSLDSYDKFSPIRVGTLVNILKVTAGPENSFAISCDGEIWACGVNNDGVLGIGSTGGTAQTPQKLTVLDGTNNVVFTDIKAGKNHTIALDSTKNVWVWGSNSFGQLGVSGLTAKNSPYKLVNADLNNKVIAIAAGHFFNIALVDSDSDGIGDAVYSWGSNEYGQIGNGVVGGPGNFQATPYKITASSISSITKMAAGGYHAIVLKSNKTVWTWGRNNQGQLGKGDKADSGTPTQVNTGTDIVNIAAGAQHTLAIKNSGSLLAWGYNQYGQLGGGETPTTSFTSPQDVLVVSNCSIVGAGISHSIVMTESGTIWAWGSNLLGQLAKEASTQWSFTPLQVSGL